MSPNPTLYAIDRFDGDLVVLVDNSGGVLEVDRSLLPHGAGEGTVLRVGRSGDSGRLEWGSVEVAKDEEQARLEAAGDIIDELKKRDPGGDVSL